jgi:hypothetical protein
MCKFLAIVLLVLCLVNTYAQDNSERGLRLVRVSPMGEKVTGRQFLLTILAQSLRRTR